MIISTINLKGGVGKTTTAIALATAAVRDGKDVELYDCDPQSSASLWAMMAEEAGDPLPFPVTPANVATVRMSGRRLKGTEGKWLFYQNLDLLITYCIINLCQFLYKI